MFIIDFDDTLFDTNALKQAKLMAAKEAGVSENIFWETYAAARNHKNGAFIYSSKTHARELAKHGFEEKIILAALKKIDDNMGRFIFSDAVMFLEKIKALSKKMILLSLGEETYQREKVSAAGIEKYFDEIIIVNETKERALKDFLQTHASGTVWLVNDKPDESACLKNKFPNINFVLKKAKKYSDEEYRQTGIPSFYTLMEIYGFITK